MNERSNSNTTVKDGKKERQKKEETKAKRQNKQGKKTNILALANSWRITLFKGPDALGNFSYFSKKFVIISVIQVRPVNFFPTKFCQALPNFTGAVVLLWSRTNFCQV